MINSDVDTKIILLYFPTRADAAPQFLQKLFLPYFKRADEKEASPCYNFSNTEKGLNIYYSFVETKIKPVLENQR